MQVYGYQRIDGHSEKLPHAQKNSHEEAHLSRVSSFASIRGNLMGIDDLLDRLADCRLDLADFHIRSLFVFGSCARGQAARGSDIDILVEFEEGAAIGLFRFLELRDTLSRMLGRPVDLVTRDALHPALADRILAEAILVA
jgi:hypothetical protein